jgi:hypothetical protein
MMQASGGFAMWRGQPAQATANDSLMHIDVQATGEPSCFKRGIGMACGWRNARSELSVAQIAPDGQVADIPVQVLGRIAGVKCLTLASGGEACIVTGTDKSLRYLGLLQAPHVLPDTAPTKMASVAPARIADSLEGSWQLSDISSRVLCSVSLQPAEGVRPGNLRFAPGCRAITLPQGLSVWKRDLGSLRFTGAATGNALHFTPMGGDRWMSPTQSSAVVLSRAPSPVLKRDHNNPAFALRRGRGRMRR